MDESMQTPFASCTPRAPMRRLLWLIPLSIAFLLLVGQAQAQEPSSPVESDTTQTPPPDRCDGVADADACWDLALGLLQRGEWDAATSVMRSFARLWPDDDRSSRAQAVADAIESSGRTRNESSLIQQSGRIELIVFSTLYGAGLGGLVGSFDDRDGSTVAITSAVGGLAGLATSILVTRNRPVNASQAALVSAGAVWGFGIGAIGSLTIDPGQATGQSCEGPDFCDYPTSREPRWREWGIGMSLAGLTGAAVLAHRYPNLPRGDIALVNATGLWGTIFAGELTGLLLGDNHIGEYSVPRGALAGTLLGLGGGAALASRLDMSANRVRLGNLGGALGAGVGFAVISQLDYPDTRTVIGIQLASQVVGITSALLLTRERAHSRRDAEATRPTSRPPLVWNVAPGTLNDGARQHAGMMFSGSF
jgi:hypothetical protein